MRVLITGAAGFIGYHLCRRLLKEGFEVVGVDNINSYYDIRLKYARLNDLGVIRKDAEKYHFECKSKIFTNFNFIRLNLEDKKQLFSLFKEKNFDIVCNLAAQAGVRYSIENPDVYIQSNIIGFLNILECCRHFKIKHLVYASSSSVYGSNKKIPFTEEDNVDKPISLYAATKKSNELMAYTYSHLYNIPTTGLRFFTVYGPWGRPDMAPMLFANAITNNRPIKIFNNGNMSRDFTYIDDVINGIEIILQNPPVKSSFNPAYKLTNIGNGNPQSLIDFINVIEKKIGIEAKKEFMPMQPGDVPKTWADITDIEKLGYKSLTNINEGIAKFIHWFKEYHI